MRKRSSKGGGAQRSIQVHLMVNEEEAAMIRAAARKRNQTVSLWIQTYRLNPSKPSSQESRGFNHGSVNSSLPFCTEFAPLLY